MHHNYYTPNSIFQHQNTGPHCIENVVYGFQTGQMKNVHLFPESVLVLVLVMVVTVRVYWFVFATATATEQMTVFVLAVVAAVVSVVLSV